MENTDCGINSNNSFINAKNENHILNIPIRNENTKPVISHETILFEQLSSSNNKISIQELADAYITVMTYYNLPSFTKSIIKNEMLAIYFKEGYYLTTRVNNDDIFIMEYNFYKSLKYFFNELNWRICNNRIIHSSNKIKYRINWHKYGIIIISLLFDAIILSFVTVISKKILSWVTLIRIASTLCSLNLFNIVLTYLDSSKFDIDKIITIIVPIENIKLFRCFCRIKFYIFYTMYILAYMLQINLSLNKCKYGCAKNDILIVNGDSYPIVISWKYFMSKCVYLFMLLVIVLFISLHIVEHKHSLFYITTIFLILFNTIQQLLDINSVLLYWINVPLLLIFIVDHWNEIYYQKFGINHIIRFKSYIKIPIIPRKNIKTKINKFNCMLVNIKHKCITNNKWKKCLISFDDIYNCTYITINNYNYKQSIDDKKYPLYIGYGSISKFRLYSSYNIICAFCKNTCIYTIIAIINKEKMLNNCRKIKLFWIITNIELMIDFNMHLNIIKNISKNIDITIYYAPKSSNNNYLSQSTLNKFNYLQCVIHFNTNIDILTRVRSDNYCIINKLNVYDILNEILLTMYSIGEYSTIGIFTCGDISFINNVNINANLLINNHYGINLNIWSECV